jgi:hypothetical protein
MPSAAGLLRSFMNAVQRCFLISDCWVQLFVGNYSGEGPKICQYLCVAASENKIFFRLKYFGSLGENYLFCRL